MLSSTILRADSGNKTDPNDINTDPEINNDPNIITDSDIRKLILLKN